MAQRRMVSSRVANSAKFLQMPMEAQLFYFHLIIRADDDGIVECYPIIKLLGIAPDAVRVLITKDFIRQLNEDQVMVITDWEEHNTIRADRKVNSIYNKLLKETYPDIKTIEPKPRVDVIDNSARVSENKQVDSPRSAEVKLSKVKLSKDKIIKYTIAETSSALTPTNKALEQIPDLLKDKQNHIQIIGLFARAKKITFSDREQQNSFIRRNLRAAQNLKAYQPARVAEVMKYLIDNADFKWTLETVGKYIDEDLTKLKAVGQTEDDLIKSILSK